jgi:hypothetical protein
MPEPSVDGPRRRDDFRTLAHVADIALAVLAGLLLYLLSVWLVVGPGQVIPAEVRRPVEIGRFLVRQAQTGTHGKIYCLGSSVGVEGLDCRIIDEALGASEISYNCCWTGAESSQWLLLMPSVAACRPRAVVLCVDLFSLCGRKPIPPALLNMCAWEGVPAPSEIHDISGFLTESELALITSSHLDQLFRFRTLPLGAFDSWARETARRDLRCEGYTTNFTAPWVRRLTVDTATLSHHLDQLAAGLAKEAPEGRADALRVLNFVANYFEERSSRAILVLTPLHPELARRLGSEHLEEYRRLLRELCQRDRAAFIDHSSLLSAEQFSDGIHANESGRRTWSLEFGRALRSIRTAGES